MSEIPEKPKTNPFSDFALVFTAATVGYSFMGYTLADNPAGAKWFMAGTMLSGGLTAVCVTAGKVWETYKKPEPEKPPAP